MLRLLEGYSYSYHISFLEAVLNKTPPEQDEVENSDTLVKIKLLGQKNQLCDVLRTLKGINLIGNSYEDLAVILKQNVDIFNNTSLSTIQKEMGKDKRPPKIRESTSMLKKRLR